MTYQNVLITGASSGLGRGLARRFAAEGAHVIAVARRKELLDSLVSEATNTPGRITALAADVGEPLSLVEHIRRLDRELGGLDLIVANAAIGITPPLHKLTFEVIAPMLQVNFQGAIATLTAVLPQMLERKRGHLVGVSSIAGLLPVPASNAYAATKAGLTMFLESLRLELLGTGVDISIVHPGFVKTEMTAGNKFKMPMIMELDTAVELIHRGILGRKHLIDFPTTMALGARAASTIPTPLYDAIARRFKIG